ncbi:MAG: hypothetical protein SFZ02_19310 [bacterium]|nr:hypothetical protein [bacterium]
MKEYKTVMVCTDEILNKMALARWRIEHMQFEDGVLRVVFSRGVEPAIVLKDDETVPGEAVYADYKAFKIFIVPRLARMIDMPALVLVSQMENGLVKVIGLDHKNNWYLKTEHKDGTYGGIDTYFNMTELVNALWNAYPKAKWQMRQLGPGGGRFNTVYTQDWNKDVNDGRE